MTSLSQSTSAKAPGARAASARAAGARTASARAAGARAACARVAPPSCCLASPASRDLGQPPGQLDLQPVTTVIFLGTCHNMKIHYQFSLRKVKMST